MARLSIKKGDNVLVTAGIDSGKVAEVLECFPEEGKVTVKGVHMITKHNKPRSAQDKGGIVKKEGKIDASNVSIVCPACGKATRVAHGKNDKGEKVRLCKKCGASLDSGVKKPTEKKAPKAEKVEKTEPAVEKKEEKAKKPATSRKSSTAVKTTKSVSTVKKNPSTTKKIGGK